MPSGPFESLTYQKWNAASMTALRFLPSLSEHRNHASPDSQGDTSHILHFRPQPRQPSHIRSLSSKLCSRRCGMSHRGWRQFGTLRAVRAPPALLSCNNAFGPCQATCSTVLRARANGPTVLDQLMQQMGGLSLGANGEGAVDGLMDGFAKMNVE